MLKAFLERDRYGLLTLVFVGAVVFRIALYASGLVEVVYLTYDSGEYRDLARSLVDHGTFGLDGVPKMNRTPGYPAFLAAVFSLFGASRFAVTSAQVVLDSLTCVMVVHIAMVMRLSRPAVMTAAVLAISCLYTAVYSMMMMTEVLYTFLITASLWALATSPTPKPETLFNATTARVILSAAALGCGTLVRPALAPMTALFAALVLGAGLLRHGTWRVSFPVLRQHLAFGAVLLAIVAPWMLRNYVVFHDEFAKGRDDVTLFGYKTDIPTYRHWFSKEVRGYLYSNEEPFLILQPYRAPLAARYVYPEEKGDLQRLFAKLEGEILSGSQPVEPATLREFERISEKRFQAAPRLHVTAPLSRVVKLWATPRIASFWRDTSGFNSSLPLIAGLTAYNVLYVLPGMLGIVWSLRRKHPVAFLFVLAMVAGHTWLYTIWLPMPQSRYAIPLFPLLVLAAGTLVHHLTSWATTRGLWRADTLPITP